MFSSKITSGEEDLSRAGLSDDRGVDTMGGGTDGRWVEGGPCCGVVFGAGGGRRQGAGKGCIGTVADLIK
jgi:hypothetical protein